MKTSISRAALSRTRKVVEARGGATISAMTLACRARLRRELRAAIDPRNARQQVIHLGLCRRGDRSAGLALRAGGDDAALPQDVFAHREARAGLLFVADQRQMRVEQVMCRVAL